MRVICMEPSDVRICLLVYRCSIRLISVRISVSKHNYHKAITSSELEVSNKSRFLVLRYTLQLSPFYSLGTREFPSEIKKNVPETTRLL